MAFAYFYYDGADGRHYCYAKAPTFLCPMAEPVEYIPAADGGEGGEHRVKLSHLGLITASAEMLGMEPLALGKIIKRGHSSHLAGRARDDAGKLTNRCGVCGSVMERKGFRVWIEAEPTEEDVQSRIAGRLGFSGYRTVPGSSFYLDTKKEAQQWARDESKIERAATS